MSIFIFPQLLACDDNFAGVCFLRFVVPDSPGRAARNPEILEHFLLSQCVHARPEPTVLEARQLALSSESLERIVFPRSVIAFDVIENCFVENEEATVDPTF